MRLRTISESSSFRNTVHPRKAIEILRRVGVDLNSSAVRKLINWAYKSGRKTTYPGDFHNLDQVIRELEDGTRLAAWLYDSPKDHELFKYMSKRYANKPYHGIENDNGFVFFKPENADIINLLYLHGRSSPANDVLNGLIFGYNPEDVSNFSSKRATNNAIYRWLKKYRVESQPTSIYHGKIVLNGLDVDSDRHKLENAGIKTYDPPYYIEDFAKPYNFMVAMPDDLEHVPFDAKMVDERPRRH